jgi:hypothetical protein
MKYFLDTEFIEGFRKPLFGKRSHFIDLISIGIVAEDGRTYYAISNEYNYNDADDWVKENVIIPMYTQEISGDRRNHIDAEHFHKCIPNGKSNKQIAEEIKHFCNPELFLHNTAEPELEFYGYYADYDWVLLCSLFGRMIDLPKYFPMYCKDLKQYFDDVQYTQKYDLKQQPNYPKQQNEHNALSDAKWNLKLFEFVQQCRV